MTLSAMTDRLRRLAVATLLLVLLGAGSAAAYWTAQATAHSRATAASVGLEQALPLTGGSSPLAGTYSAEQLALAGTVTITNTGSRAAEYTLEVAPGLASSAALPAAVQIAAAPVARALDCSPQAALSGARTGNAGAGLSLHGELAAGATATVCLQTSLTAAAHASLPAGTLELAMTSSLEYARASQWQLTADRAMSVTQTVKPAPPAEPEAKTMTCRVDGPWEPQLAFTSPNGKKDASYRDQVQYRMFIAHADTPKARIALPNTSTTDWYTAVHLSNTSSTVKKLTASSGHGNAWLYVEMKLPGTSDWAPVATGKFHTTPTVAQDRNATGVYCGWQK